eukprot:TRINITY_DN9707_c0_g1_i1.p7 TRINITY_DN9707_c0_g1~~TRINITY_DN9707_c0_g1_i1.p7  ORF type:complete len:102 (+),score=4.27 TRINITY_DN9707_c0_g1_i1:200-505(+)
MENANFTMLRLERMVLIVLQKHMVLGNFFSLVAQISQEHQFKLSLYLKIDVIYRAVLATLQTYNTYGYPLEAIAIGLINVAGKDIQLGDSVQTTALDESIT